MINIKEVYSAKKVTLFFNAHCTEFYTSVYDLKQMHNFKCPAKPKKKHACSFCSYTTYYPSGIKTHLLKHTGEKPYQCNICSKRFTRKEYLRNHISMTCLMNKFSI
ncbi:hypothetical protein TNCT_123461 [Trichonephila clavata]|uniref:C2H2-type domain-containing protein n=1 Tax=Trichonephila clavata TaxID=2740835 RepID=A0A8X6HKH1_TRICU|nr:hypothetical protein TNCT_123461 [Trichonephila clavata]